MQDEEVDFEETVELGDAPMDETAASAGKSKGRDNTGRRLKGRGAAGSSTTMQEKEVFESIEKGGSVKGPAKCALGPQFSGGRSCRPPDAERERGGGGRGCRAG